MKVNNAMITYAKEYSEEDRFDSIKGIVEDAPTVAGFKHDEELREWANIALHKLADPIYMGY